jgi:hypothetical protein
MRASAAAAAGHERGLALYWWSVGTEAWFQLQAEASAIAYERALEHLERAAQLGSHLANTGRSRLLVSYVFAPLHVDEAIERVDSLGHGSYGAIAKASERIAYGRLYALKGEIERGQMYVRSARQTMLAAGLVVTAHGWVRLMLADALSVAGRSAESSQFAREALAVREAKGDIAGADRDREDFDRLGIDAG